MKTVGQILQSARLQKKLELADVSRITKIRPQFLVSIEADDYSHLPSGAVARGFIRNYAEFLDLAPFQLLAVFRRDFVENQHGQIVPRGMVNPVDKISFWTPRTTFIATITLILTIFTAYLFYQYRILTGPPDLEIYLPEDKQAVTQSSVEISGITSPEATLSVNGQQVALEKGGRFYFRLPLREGDNSVVITASSKSGQSTTLTRTVVLR